MLKKITLGYIFVYTLLLLIYLGDLLFVNSSSIYSIIGYGGSSVNYAFKFLENIVTSNLAGYFTIIISSVVLHKDEDKFMPKIGIIASFALCFLSLIVSFLSLNNSNLPGFLAVISMIVSFIFVIILVAFIYIVPLILISDVPSDTNAASILKKAAIALLGINAISGLIMIVMAMFPVASTSSYYGSYTTYTSYTSPGLVVARVYVYTIILVYIVIGLAHALNYTLSGDTRSDIEKEEETDAYFAELAKQAEMQAQLRQAAANNIVSEPKVEVAPVVEEPIVEEAPVVPQVQSAPQEDSLNNLMQSKPQINEQSQ